MLAKYKLYLLGRVTELPTSNTTYLPDSFTVLFAAWIFLVFLHNRFQQFYVFLYLYTNPYEGFEERRDFFPVENWTTISVSFFSKPIHTTTEKSE